MLGACIVVSSLMSSAAPAEAVPFRLGAGAGEVRVWGRGREPERGYFDEWLPALFERTLALEELDLGGGALEWIFTGERGGFTIRVEPGAVRAVQRFYDSFGLNRLEGGTVRAARHPERRWLEASAPLQALPRSIAVTLDHRLGLSVAIDGRDALRQVCLFDVRRHQLRVAGKARARGRLVRPPVGEAIVRIDPAQRRQRILGFGGIASPPAYARLGPEGKRRWWEIVCAYNLRIGREYPIGTRLRPSMDNWDRPEDATPHYYGDNFPNGEISDFGYLKSLRRLGGHVFFEFWALPPWATREVRDGRGRTRRVADPEAYARAVVAYCRASRERTGAPPDVVGIQNEIRQPPEVWHAMTRALRRALDAAGCEAVRIHLSDAGRLADGIRRAEAFRRSPEAWAAIDYAATHMYDYQAHFTDPDRYDELLRRWRRAIGDKPFLSTELCINASRYQRRTYRLALLMGELYHKNLVIAGAAAILYCWTLLDVEQPSYGWTRSLCVPDPAHGLVPVPSGYQLRVLGAYSRRIREGMVRLEAESTAGDLLASAFTGEGDARTVVLLNRATVPLRVRVAGAGGGFRTLERVDPYRENVEEPAPRTAADGATEVRVGPGAIVTLSTVPLGALPEGFAVEGDRTRGMPRVGTGEGAKAPSR